MKFAVSSYSFAQYVSDGRMTQLDTIGKAREMGFDGIEFAEINPHGGVSEEKYAVMLREEAARQGMEIVNLAVGAELLNGDVKAALQAVKRKVELAAALGSPRMRHDATSGPVPMRSFDSVLPALAEACREVTEYAAGLGVKTMVENHGYYSQDSCRVEKLVNAVNHENFGLLVDMGNFLCADENPVQAVTRTAPYAFHVHAKDFHVKSGMGLDPGTGFFRSRSQNYLRGAIVGHGEVPVSQCFAVLAAAGYKGYVSLEFEGMEDAMTGIAVGLENLKKLQGLW